MDRYDKLQAKLLKYQRKIYHVTLKYDPTTNVENYQELSVFWLEYMSTLDKIKIKYYAKRTIKLASKIKKEKDK